jgi:predicted transcriptional regulator
MTLLFHMALKDEEFTTNNILKISKLHRVSLLRIFNELNEKGLLEREQITNIQNRGHTFRYLFSTSLLRRIAALKASDAKKKRD